MHRLLLVVAVLAAPLALAQSPLVYTPDSLAAPFSELTVTNPTAAPIQIEGFDGRLGPGAITAAGWIFEVEVEGAVRLIFLHLFIGPNLPAYEPVNLTLAPGAAGTIRLDGYDPCIGCRPGGVSRVDTLFVVTDAGTDRLRLDTAGIVTVEGGPEVEASTLSVSPNPARDRSVVTLHAPEGTSEATVEVFDATGRRMAVARAGPAPSGPLTARLDVAAWPAGVYLVRASLDDQRVVAPLTVVR